MTTAVAKNAIRRRLSKVNYQAANKAKKAELLGEFECTFGSYIDRDEDHGLVDFLE